MPDTHVVLFPAQIAEMLRGQSGAVTRHMIVLGEKVKNEAIRLAPRKTGNLAAHIVKRLVPGAHGVSVHVGVVNVPYAEHVVKGTRPHEIRPKTPGGVLAFFWPKVGQTVFFRSVQHPGTKPNLFLQRALEVID